MRRQTDQIFKMKLYLLAIGILILVLLLMRGVKEEEKPQADQAAEKEERTEPEEPSKEEQEIKTPVYNGKIRVLLKTDGFVSEFHESVSIASDCELTVRAGGSGESYGSGTELTFTREEDVLFLNGEALADAPACFIVEPGDPQGGERLTVQSLCRGCGTPSYEGKLEIWRAEEGFVLINELPLETYLKYVVPSEMPAGYETEALKAQAVCARTYAYKHMQSYGYPEYEAHVDDSVRYQVYHNTDRAESTDRAVDETWDLILTWEGLPVTAYYFSTSCGYTGNEEIWWDGSAKLTPYLKGKTVNEAGETLDMTDEAVFADFISRTDEGCYDAQVSWYRWETEIGVEALSENLNQALKVRYDANPQAILTKRGRNYTSKAIDTIGTIREIEILERNEGGAIQRLRIKGSRRTIQVDTEYNARALLNVQGCSIVRHDGSSVEGGTLLPSAYMTITPVYGEDETLTAYKFSGGGYGHGVGMSQNGANGMAQREKNFEEILHFFYTNVELTNIGGV